MGPDPADMDVEPAGGGAGRAARLDKYRLMRRSGATPEPMGEGEALAPRAFVVQKHAARRLHFDLRLEHAGVLLSWAVPRGPCLDPKVVRLAVETEDHPLEYADFEGVIPEGNYGAGAMIVWDRGVWTPLEIEPGEGLEEGKLLFELQGYKLRGVWTLVRTAKNPKEWLLIKKPDGWARPGSGEETEFDETSVLSGLTVDELREGGDRAAAIVGRLDELGAPDEGPGIDDVDLVLAEVADGPFTREGWIFELKYDGYRLLAGREGDEAALRYRSGADATAVFPELVRTLEALPYDSLVIDGEVVVLDEGGRPRFQRLQKRGRLTRPHDIHAAAASFPATLFAFDLVAFEGRDLRDLPLEARKELLKEVLPGAGPIRYADHVEAAGEALFERVVEMGLEGLVAKDAASRYVGGRTDRWLKIRAERSGLFVVVGTTAPKGGRAGFGALHLAAWADVAELDAGTGAAAGGAEVAPRGADGDGARAAGDDGHGEAHAAAGGDRRLLYLGRVGSGFADRQLDEIAATLEGTEADPDLAGPVPEGDEHTWVEPRLVCEVRYKEITEEGLLRQPVFLGLAPDVAPAECTLEALEGGDHQPPEPPDPDELDAGVEVARGEAEAAAATVRRGDVVSRPKLELTRLDKVFWPDDGKTKGDLIAYYEAVADRILPYLRDRPLVLDRFPDGIDGTSFFQKNAPEFTPSWIRTVTIEESGDKVNDYIVCDDLDTLRYVANSAAIPLHLWSSRVSSLERPDWCILDLDPKDAPFESVVTVARAIRDLCDEMEVGSHVKTSGKTGLHVLVPLGRQFTWEQAKLFGELVARVVAGEHADIATTIRNPAGRGARVYIDYVQNGRGKLLVAPLCVRPVPGATVSTPLRWREVTPRLDVGRFTIDSVPRRLAQMKDDPMLGVLDDVPDLGRALEVLGERLA